MYKKEIATFGAGCFWGVELGFSKLSGVLSTKVGYMGGDENKYPNPTYEQVCTDKTMYAEVLKVEFDPEKISYNKLLDFFWENHNPTTFNQQGPDFGTQYISVIFYYNDKQRKESEFSLKERQKKLGKERKIVTEIVKASTFYPAEEYHQKYLEKNRKESCHI